MEPQVLTAERVRSVMMETLFTDDEASPDLPENAVRVQGIVNDYAFHPERLAAKRPEIVEMLSVLPDEFRSDKGGGWSFLNGCMTRDGRQWGEQPDVGALLALGIGVGAAKYLMPREMWSILPGSVPYFSVTVN